MSDDDNDEKVQIDIKAGVSVSTNISKKHGKVKLFERIFGIAEKWSEPIHKVREAESGKKVARIKRETELQNAAHDALMERINNRTASENMRDQENLENICHSAGEDIDEDADVENVDNDWMRYYTENARLISDDKMQQIWANILSGEVNAPGKFSKKTLSILQTLSKSDAELFENFCAFNCYISNSQLTPVVLEHNNSIYDDNGINFIKLIRLSNLGLIEFDKLGNLGRDVKNLKSDTIALFFIYCDVFILFEINKNPCTFKNGHCLLTQSGQELAKICSPQKIEGFLEYVIGEMRKQGYIISEQYNKDNIPPTYRELLEKRGMDFF